MYSDRVSPFIAASQDDQGSYHYNVVPGKGDVLLGYSKCLDATKFRDVVADSNNESHVWIYLNSTNKPPQTENRPASGFHYRRYIDTASGEYDFYQTMNDSNSEELWVGVLDDDKSEATCGESDFATQAQDGLPLEKSQGPKDLDSYFSNVTTAGEIGGVVGAVYGAVSGARCGLSFARMDRAAYILDPEELAVAGIVDDGGCTLIEVGMAAMCGAGGAVAFCAGGAVVAGIAAGVWGYCQYYGW
ncbi:MAG: hypothetical protein FJ390_03560 [Verrucomicrobia bacterium]|nr:hypothetical protein [Verrucomicrobiota bacterium]